MSWPPEDGDLARLVVNGMAQLEWIAAAGARWPVTIGAARQGAQATWLTSLVAALIGAAKDEVAGHDAAAVVTRGVLGAVERVAIALGADRAVLVNNGLLSVSPVGPSQLDGLAAALSSAGARWPDRTIAARGIVAAAEAVKACAARAGGVVVPSRVSYAFDLTDGTLPDKINAARDEALLRKKKLRVLRHDDFSAQDLAAAHAQYTAVYIGRHGSRNPALTPAFFSEVHRARAAEFFGLAVGEDLAAFVALRDNGDFLSVPLIGYRTDVDKKEGLYRQVFALALEVGCERRRIVNFGAGAAHYKKLRGAAPAVEYMILIPPRTTRFARAVRAMLEVSEAPLGRFVPKAIMRFGG